MTTTYGKVFTLAVNHKYYEGIWPEVEFLPSPSTEDLLRKLRITLKFRDGLLLAYAPVPSTFPKEGATLSFALRSTNSNFSNFTALNLDPQSKRPGFLSFNTPTTAPASLDKPIELKWAKEDLDSQLAAAQKKFSESSEDEGARCVLARAIERLKEEINAIVSQGAFATINLSLTREAFAARPSEGLTYRLVLETRSVQLRYCILATGYSSQDLDTFAIEEVDHALEQRDKPLSFTRKAARSSGASPVLLDFSSAAPIPLKSKYHSRFQLRKNGDIIISSLRRPAESQADGTMLLSLSKT